MLTSLWALSLAQLGRYQEFESLLSLSCQRLQYRKERFHQQVQQCLDICGLSLKDSVTKMPTKWQNSFLKTVVLFPFPNSIYKISNSSPSSKLSKALSFWQLRQVSLLQTLERVHGSRSSALEQLPKISLALKRQSCWCCQSSFVLLGCQTFGSDFPNQFSRPCRKLN